MTTYNLVHAANTAVADLLTGEGGATVSLTGALTPTSGYAVSLSGHERIHETVNLPDVAEYYYSWLYRFGADNLPTLLRPSHYLGAWLDGDLLYLDVTVVVPELAAAVELGKANKQLAIYDLGMNEEIRLDRVEPFETVVEIWG
jgi:hypothetical protein